MKTFINSSTLALSALAFGLASCGGNEQLVENSIESQLMENVDSTVIEVSQEEIFELIETFPTPIEMALAIKKSDNDFSTDMLLTPDNIDRFATSYDQAIALGAYGSDMGYLNIYTKIFLIPDYLVSLRQISKELDLDNFFDFDMMLSLAENSNNLDSLIQISTESFNSMEAHLRDKGRDELSILIVFGTWLEGAYVIADIAQKSQNEELYDRVALQKDFVDKLNEIFSTSEDPYFQELSSNLQPLKALYDKVGIELVMKPSTMEEVDGQLVFIDNNETIITADEGLIMEIISETVKTRNTLLK